MRPSRGKFLTVLALVSALTLPRGSAAADSSASAQSGPSAVASPTAAGKSPAGKTRVSSPIGFGTPIANSTPAVSKGKDVWSVAGEPTRPTGFAPKEPLAPTPRVPSDRDFLPIPDRWRVDLPSWDRYPRGTPGEYPYTLGAWWDPYDQNMLKGDYPIIGEHTFLDLTGVSDTDWTFVRLPIASGVSTQSPNSPNFFGSGDEQRLQQNFITSFDLFHGDAGFKPLDWELKLTPVFNINYLDTKERGIVNIDPSAGTTRRNGHIAFEEAFLEYKLTDLSPYYDFLSVRTGIQPFTSDFRGFIFSDNAPGVLLFGNFEANRDLWNIGYFRPLEKDTNSGLNKLMEDRDQNVIAANLTRQDFLFPGYFFQLDFDYDNDNPGQKFNDNGFLVRPSEIGTVRNHAVNAAYFGCTSDGHIGRINVSHAFYEVVGSDSFNNIAGRPVHINAQMAALELSYDHDWQTYRTSFFYASGAGNPDGRSATGFDSIEDNVNFVGSQFNYFNRVGIGLTGTGVPLINQFSLVPDLRDKLQGQANFVNPGIWIYNGGADFALTPELKLIFNTNFLQFDKVAVLENVLHQGNLGHNIGVDYSVGFNYRPLLIDNIIFSGAIAALSPMSGFKDIYQSNTLFSSFLAMTLTY